MILFKSGAAMKKTLLTAGQLGRHDWSISAGIFRGGAYEKFLAKDIAGMLELIDLFQQGTHGIEPSFTEHQLHALRFRVESALRFLLEIEFTANR